MNPKLELTEATITEKDAALIRVNFLLNDYRNERDAAVADVRLL